MTIIIRELTYFWGQQNLIYQIDIQLIAFTETSKFVMKKTFFDKVETTKRGRQNGAYVVGFQNYVKVYGLKAHFHLKKD